MVKDCTVEISLDWFFSFWVFFFWLKPYILLGMFYPCLSYWLSKYYLETPRKPQRKKNQYFKTGSKSFHDCSPIFIFFFAYWFYKLDLHVLNDVSDLILLGRMSSLCVLSTTEPVRSQGFLQSVHKDLGAGYALSLGSNLRKSSFSLERERK